MNKNFLCLDVGEKRVGVAFAHEIALLPRPLITLDTETAPTEIEKLLMQESVGTVVVGLPLNRNDQPTEQTNFTKAFVSKIKINDKIGVEYCDEALSSQRAKKELADRGSAYSKGDIDALAATYILTDYLREKGLTSA